MITEVNSKSLFTAEKTAAIARLKQEIARLEFEMALNEIVPDIDPDAIPTTPTNEELKKIYEESVKDISGEVQEFQSLAEDLANWAANDDPYGWRDPVIADLVKEISPLMCDLDNELSWLRKYHVFRFRDKDGGIRCWDRQEDEDEEDERD